MAVWHCLAVSDRSGEKFGVKRVVTGLPSLALPDGTDASGVADIEFDAYGNAYAIIGFAGNPALRDSVIQVPDFNYLIAIENFDGGSTWTRLVDLGAYELLNNPDGQDVNTNIFDLLIQDNRAYVIDAGGNDLLSLRAFSSELELETVFPARLTTNPFTGGELLQQSVPNSIAVGPDGAFYVGELTGFPFQEGAAQVYRLGAEGQPEVYANGFTNIIDLAFDKAGGLYVLEYDADGLLNEGVTGALIYVSPDGTTRTTIADDELIAPTGLTIGSNGDIYISNKGFIPGEGEVLRIENPIDTDAPIAELVDLTGFDGDVTVNVTVDREAGFDNILRFYETDAQGRVGGLLPGEAGYEAAAAANLLEAELYVDNNVSADVDLTLTGGTYYAPALLINGSVTNLATIEDAALGNVRIKREGDVWGFEDLTDNDFNDLVVTLNSAEAVVA
jgi:hypothetical protein